MPKARMANAHSVLSEMTVEGNHYSPLSWAVQYSVYVVPRIQSHGKDRIDWTSPPTFLWASTSFSKKASIVPQRRPISQRIRALTQLVSRWSWTVISCFRTKHAFVKEPQNAWNSFLCESVNKDEVGMSDHRSLKSYSGWSMLGSLLF
jgi:hypothetical protein